MCFLPWWGIVALPPLHHFQAQPTSAILPQFTWHYAHTKALVQSNDKCDMGRHGKHMILAQAVIVDIPRPHFNNWRHKGGHLQVHPEYIQRCLETIQSFGLHCPPLLHQYNIVVHLADPQKPPNETVQASSRTLQSQCQRHFQMASNIRSLQWWTWPRWWKQQFIRYGWSRQQSPNWLEVNATLLDAICQWDGAAQL